MDLKSLVQKCVYRIEPNPVGGFIARPADPTIPPLEAPTREELQQKIQAKAIAALGEAFPSFTIPLQDKRLKLELHIDHTPGGGFKVHSEDPGTAMDPATREKIDHFAEHFLDFVEKHFPHLAETIATQANGKAIQVLGTERLNMSGNSPLEISQGFNPSQPAAGNDTVAVGVQSYAANAEQAFWKNTALANAPITPESSGSGRVFLFILALLALAALIYFFVYQR
jgi:hypothetical protein